MVEKKRQPASPSIKQDDRLELLKKKAPKLNVGNLVVGTSVLSVLLSVLIAVKVLTPVLIAASVFPLFFAAMRKSLHRIALELVIRWAITVFIFTALSGGFVTERTERSIPFARQTVETIKDWIGAEGGTPPADFYYLFGGILIFAAATLSSGGAAGFIIGALGLASSGFGAAYLFLHGDNIFHVLLIALPPWQLSLFVACIFLSVPIALLFFNRFYEKKDAGELGNIRLYAYLGTGLFLLSLLLRIATTGIWKSLTLRWTVF